MLTKSDNSLSKRHATILIWYRKSSSSIYPEIITKNWTIYYIKEDLPDLTTVQSEYALRQKKNQKMYFSLKNANKKNAYICYFNQKKLCLLLYDVMKVRYMMWTVVCIKKQLNLRFREFPSIRDQTIVSGQRSFHGTLGPKGYFMLCSLDCFKSNSFFFNAY